MRTWIIMLLRRFGFYGTMDTNKVIGTLKKENIRLKKQIQEMQGFTTIHIDPTMRQKGYEQSAWNSERERNTDPNVQGARQRSTMHQVYSKPGDMLKHVNEVERKKYETRKLNPEDTHELHRMPHTLSFTRLVQDDSFLR